MSHQNYFVYILTNDDRHTVLYIGVTNELERRANEHSLGRGVFSRNSTMRTSSSTLRRIPIRKVRSRAKSS